MSIKILKETRDKLKKLDDDCRFVTSKVGECVKCKKCGSESLTTKNTWLGYVNICDVCETKN